MAQFALWARGLLGALRESFAPFAVKIFLPQSPRRTAAKVAKHEKTPLLKLSHDPISGAV
jgi:hypothetical protein